MIYKYTMILKPVITSAILSYFEGSDTYFQMAIPVEVESELSEEDKVFELDEKVGTKTPDGKYEFVGYKDLVKVIRKTHQCPK